MTLCALPLVLIVVQVNDSKAKTFWVPTSYSRLIARELGLQERELARLLVATGLSTSIFLAGDESRMTAEQQVQVLENALQIIGGPEFGLRLGRSLEPSTHGPMGYLILSSANVLSALEAFAEFLPVRLPFSAVAIDRVGDWIECKLTLKIDVGSDVRRLLHECFALMIQSVVESVSGLPLAESEIGLTHSRPSYYKQYPAFFRVPVSFDEPVSFVRLPKSLASVPNINGHSESYAVARDLCLALLDAVPGNQLSTEDQVRRLLLSAPLGSLTALDVASAMFITKRTLQRRLDREGTTYRQLLEQLLSELAVRHLCESSLSIDSIAATLGYYDAAAFRKAFVRWFGMTPSEYRSRGVPV